MPPYGMGSPGEKWPVARFGQATNWSRAKSKLTKSRVILSVLSCSTLYPVRAQIPPIMQHQTLLNSHCAPCPPLRQKNRPPSLVTQETQKRILLCQVLQNTSAHGPSPCTASPSPLARPPTNEQPHPLLISSHEKQSLAHDALHSLPPRCRPRRCPCWRRPSRRRPAPCGSRCLFHLDPPPKRARRGDL